MDVAEPLLIVAGDQRPALFGCEYTVRLGKVTSNPAGYFSKHHQ